MEASAVTKALGWRYDDVFRTERYSTWPVPGKYAVWHGCVKSRKAVALSLAERVQLLHPGWG